LFGLSMNPDCRYGEQFAVQRKMHDLKEFSCIAVGENSPLVKHWTVRSQLYG
jgi:hypothetical protein